MSKKVNQTQPKRELVNKKVGLTKLRRLNSTEKQKEEQYEREANKHKVQNDKIQCVYEEFRKD